MKVIVRMISSSVNRAYLHRNAGCKYCIPFGGAIATFPAGEGLGLRRSSVYTIKDGINRTYRGVEDVPTAKEKIKINIHKQPKEVKKWNTKAVTFCLKIRR